MTTNLSQSATIYTFPARGRFAIDGERGDQKSVADNQLPRGATIVSGSAWYHDEAIRTDWSGKN